MKKVITAVLIAAFCLSGMSVSAENGVALPIVMYHHISPTSEKWNDYVISLEEFRADMEYLNEHGWTPVSVTQLLEWSRGEFTMPEKPCIISFDDGFSSTAEYAEPILAQLGFRAVVAVIGSVCQQYSENGEYDPEWSDMSWEQAAEMAARGVIQVQCHTWDLHSKGNFGCRKIAGESAEHYSCRIREDLGRFLEESERHGLELTGTIAYPYGAYERQTTAIIKEIGFLAAFTCTEKINILSGDEDELYHLGRFNRPHGVSSEKFFEKWEKSY